MNIMGKILQNISSLMFTFFLFITVNAPSSVFLCDIESETSLESHRQCSADDVTGRLSKTFPSRAARKLKNAIRYPKRFFQGSLSLVGLTIKKPTVCNTTPDIATVVLLTTVLRI